MVAVNTFEGAERYSLDEIREALGLDDGIPRDGLRRPGAATT